LATRQPSPTVASLSCWEGPNLGAAAKVWSNTPKLPLIGRKSQSRQNRSFFGKVPARAAAGVSTPPGQRRADHSGQAGLGLRG
jgi:hypothetical protein